MNISVMESHGYHHRTSGNSDRSPAGTRSWAPATTAGGSASDNPDRLTSQIPHPIASAVSEGFTRERGLPLYSIGTPAMRSWGPMVVMTGRA